MSEPPGTAPERTALAWQRTALALAVAGVVLARLTVGRAGPLAGVVTAVAVLLAVWVVVESALRGRRPHPGSGGLARDGRAPAALVVATVLLTLAEGAALLRG